MVERERLGPQYKVGYAKPPEHTQFTRGRSGNPRGRPTGSKNIATMMIEELIKTVSIVENGKRMRIAKIRAVVRQALNKAVGCDFKALQQIVSLLRSCDALKRVATTKTKTTIPKIHEGLSASEAAKLWQQTLADTGANSWDD